MTAPESGTDQATQAVDDAPKPEAPEPAKTTTSKAASSKSEPAKPKASKLAPQAPATPKQGITVSPLALVLAALVVILAVLATAFGFLWLSASSERDDARTQLESAQQTSDTNARAQDIAKKYSIGAATIDYQNLAAWRTALTAGTTTELAAQLREASTQFEQVVVPLQWQSTATPLGTVVTANKDGLITVNVFLNMTTKSTQRPEGIPSTATYTLTIDTKQNWQISDVRGMDAALSGK